jgi:hypothetical protein
MSPWERTPTSSAQAHRGRTGHRLRVLGVLCTLASLSLWIFSLFYYEGVVWEWPDGYVLIAVGPGFCSVTGEYIPSECWSMAVNKKEAEDARENGRSLNKEMARAIRSALAGDTRIRNRWSLDRICYQWLPSCTSRDDNPYNLTSGIYLRYRNLNIPFWMPMTLIAVPTLWSYWRARERSKRGRCRECLYDLAGNVSGICPECGTPIPEHVKLEIESNKAKDGGAKFSEPAA